MGGRAEGQACAEPWARTPFGASGIFNRIIIHMFDDLYSAKFSYFLAFRFLLLLSNISCDGQLKKWHCHSVSSFVRSFVRLTSLQTLLYPTLHNQTMMRFYVYLEAEEGFYLSKLILTYILVKS